MTVQSEHRSPAAGTTPAGYTPAGLAPIGDLVEEVTREAMTLPLEYGQPFTAITRLLLGDPRNRSQVAAVAEAIIRSALADPFWETTANRWRPLIPPWVRTGSMSGATVTALVRRGILVRTGRYARCDDTSARNKGKIQPIYALDLIALRELIRTAQAASALAESA
jgi:hypothetical protein